MTVLDPAPETRAALAGRRGARELVGRIPPGAVAPMVAALVVVAVVIAGVLATHGASLGTRPIDYQEDSLFQYGVASSANEAGLSATHPRLNAPFGADWRDFAIHTDVASLTQYWVISWFSDSPVQIVNVAYFLSYLWCALVFLWAARRLGARWWIAAGLAVGYAFLPYHFFRGIHHQFMAQYWTLPIVAVLAVEVVTGTRLIAPRLRRWHRAVLLVALAAVCGLNGAYLSFFSLMLLGLASAAALLHRRGGWRATLWRVVPAIGGLCLGIVLGVMPSAVLQASDGPNYRTPARSLGDGDLFALRPATLLSPVQGHRFSPLANLAATINRLVPGGEKEPMAVGTVAVAALALALLLALRGWAAAADPADDSTATRVDRTGSRQLTALVGVTLGFTFAALTVGISGGLHWDLGIGGFALIRAWGRTSVVIATLALLVGAVWVSQRRRADLGTLARSRLGPAGTAVAMVLPAALVGGAMVWDQYPTRVTPPQQLDEFAQAQRFFHSLETKLPAKSAVFQVPVVPFPEHWLGTLLYQSLEGVFFTKTLRFSGGGIAGRQADWQEMLLAQPPELFAELHDAGFSAVIADRRGFSDSQPFLNQYGAVPGVRVLLDDGVRVAYDIRRVGPPTVRSGFDLVHQPIFSFGPGFNERLDGFFPSNADDQGGFASMTSKGTVVIRNRTNRVFRACVSFDVTSQDRHDVTVDTGSPSSDQEFTVDPSSPAHRVIRTTVAPGTTEWTVSATGTPVPNGSGDRSLIKIRKFVLNGSFDRSVTCDEASQP